MFRAETWFRAQRYLSATVRRNSFWRNPKGRLADRVAVVTGSTSGIGLAVARRLAQDGAHVVVSSRKQPNVDRAIAMLQGEGLSVSGTVCHVGKAEDRERLVAKALEHCGAVDILVCNAAVNPLVGSTLGSSEQVWDKVRPKDGLGCEMCPELNSKRQCEVPGSAFELAAAPYGEEGVGLTAGREWGLVAFGETEAQEWCLERQGCCWEGWRKEEVSLGSPFLSSSLRSYFPEQWFGGRGDVSSSLLV
ncbi:dehydrogenase/reductase SDR family member 2, mitochondrial-like [Suncus etruscus]|uniref:dehydrogenase/reductase SDR family member 2, mitochondrial-like n=1 Tax=Suncus etruscus TaxID=109475 RepID=UPI002110A1DB|nr:dehydrogenase/reductase SDR family member 2, mitochondrial-like [Suncus etruscus]